MRPNVDDRLVEPEARKGRQSAGSNTTCFALTLTVQGRNSSVLRFFWYTIAVTSLSDMASASYIDALPYYDKQVEDPGQSRFEAWTPWRALSLARLTVYSGQGVCSCPDRGRAA